MSLIAVYIHPEKGYRPAEQLKVGRAYHVERVNMGGTTTDIHLAGYGGCFNSVQFDFYEDGKPIDIYRSPKYNPYLRLQRRVQE